MRTRSLRADALAAATLVLVAVGLAPSARAQTTSGPVRGDVNADGQITALDALGILTHTVGRPLPGGYTILPNGDNNGDGQVTAVDALIGLSHTVGRDVSAFPVGQRLFDYVLELQRYHPLYDSMAPVRLLHAGDTLTTPNGLTQYFRVKLDGEYVTVGGYGHAAFAFNFTSVTPPSPFGPDDYHVTFAVQTWDATHGRAVEIPLNVTLSNEGYRRVIGRTVRVGSPPHLGSAVTTLRFSPDGALFWNGSPTSNSTWSMFGGGGAQNFQQCAAGVSSKNSLGYVSIPTWAGVGPVLPGGFLSINADGSVEFTGGPQCPEFGWSVSWVPLTGG